MTQVEALTAVLKGAKVRYRHWGAHIYIVSDGTAIRLIDGHSSQMADVSLARAEGWELYDDRPRMDFLAAVKAARDGAKVATVGNEHRPMTIASGRFVWADNIFGDVSLSEDHFLATDWVVVPE